LVLSAGINLYFIKTNTSGESLGIYASGIVGALTLLTIPIFSWIILKKNNDEDFN
jgi:hypothetical protein